MSFIAPLPPLRAAKTLPPLEELVRILSYDPATGLFMWKLRGDRWFDSHWGGRAAFITDVHGYRYAVISRWGRLAAHRVAFKMATGRDPLGEIDHINGDRSDNRACNLRDVSTAENRRNSAAPKSNTSGTVGVSYRADKKRWRAHICANGGHQHLGYFITREEAERARLKVERENGYHPNHGRMAHV